MLGEDAMSLPVPYYDDGNGIQIYLGDCRDILPHLEEEYRCVEYVTNAGMHYEQSLMERNGAVNVKNINAIDHMDGARSQQAKLTTPIPLVIITDPPYGFSYYETDNYLPVANILQGFPRKTVFGYPELLCWWCSLWGQPVEWVTWWPTNKPCGRTSGLNKESESIAIYGQLFSLPIRTRSQDSMTRGIARTRGNEVETCKDGDVWRDPSPGAGFNSHLRQHPNEKPISLLKKLICLVSGNGDTILDPFMGSGTTLVAAKDLGRKAIGIEIEEKYCEIAVRRLAQEVLPL